jgi:hypothetical protein
MTNQDQIEKFFAYFEKELRSIQSIENRLYRKIILVVIIDTLARARLPGANSTRERFIGLINTCSEWQDRDRVSLMQLSHSIPSVDSPFRNVLRSLSQWQYGRIYRVEAVDPHASELLPLAQTVDQTKSINDARHVNLLYTYRNHLVHEFREPGQGMEIGEDTVPYYHGMTHIRHSTEEEWDTWELVYPLEFIMSLAKVCLRNLRTYLVETDTNPYHCYQFGTMWRRS